jgi:pilus assembly protein CpaB
MNKNVIVILLGAVCTAFIVAIGVQSALKSDEPQVVKEAPMVEILIADEKLSQGEVIDADKVAWKKWPEDAVIKGMYEKAEDTDKADLEIIGKLARRDVEAGEPVTKSAVILNSKKEGNFLAATLGEGKLAFSIPVTPSSAVGGFAGPGDHVDVILTYTVRVPKEIQKQAQGTIQKYASETVLQNVRVLAVDQKAKEEDREAKIGKVVTLEVSPKGAEVLALSLEMGDLNLALRRLGNGYDYKAEAAAGPTTDVQISKVMRKLGDIEKSGAKRGSVEGDEGSAVVRIYRGNQVEDVVVPLADM